VQSKRTEEDRCVNRDKTDMKEQNLFIFYKTPSIEMEAAANIPLQK